MRCNRKTACFAVTPRKKVAGSLNITKIWQLRRRENPKAEIAGVLCAYVFNFVYVLTVHISSFFHVV